MVLIIVSIGLTVYRMFFILMVSAPLGAMKNTIMPGDRLIVNRAFGAIDRGRLVVFQYPDNSTYYLSRIIGLPGETIQIRGRVVYINERPLDEQRVTAKEPDMYGPLVELSREGKGPYKVFYTRTDEEHSAVEFPFAGDTSFRIPPKSYFVMSDNRDNAEDSRYRGAVPRELIWGNASVIYYSATIPQGEIRWERVFKRVH
jgi:signal peptidase I